MRRQYVVRGERVGQHAYSDIAFMQSLDGGLRTGGQNEVRRFDEQLLLQPGDPLANESDAVIALLAASDGLRVVGDDLAVGPDEIVTKLGALGHQLVQVLVD